MKGFILAVAIPSAAARAAYADPVAWHNLCVAARNCLIGFAS